MEELWKLPTMTAKDLEPIVGSLEQLSLSLPGCLAGRLVGAGLVLRCGLTAAAPPPDS